MITHVFLQAWTLFSLASGTAIPWSNADGVECEEIGDWDYNAWINELFPTERNQISNLRQNQCLFGTKNTGITRLESIAKQYNLITIWDIFYDISLYDKSEEKYNSLRCILNDDAKARQYFSSLSSAFASKCRGQVIVLVDDAANPAASLSGSGIWPISVSTMLTIGLSDTDADISIIAFDGQKAAYVWPQDKLSEDVELTKRPSTPSWWYDTRSHGNAAVLQGWYGDLSW